MILEVGDGAEVRARVRLDALPLVVGRSLSADVVVDDPYVDARHARIVADEEGGVWLEDLGSVNGLVAPAAGGRVRRLAAVPGREVRLGRTTLRFRDPDEALAPALRDEPEGAMTRVLASRVGRAALVAAGLAAVGATTWTDSYGRDAGEETVEAMMALALAGCVWAGLWSIGSRVTTRRFRFTGHLAVACGAMLGAGLLDEVQEWSTFLLPGTEAWMLVLGPLWLALGAALVAGHLSLASGLSPRGRWKAGAVTSVLLVSLPLLATLAEDDSFSDVPEFAGQLKPLPRALVPAGGAAEMAGVARELRDEVDALAKD